MPIVIVDNFDVNVGKNIDSRYGPYATVAQATGSIDPIFRFKGLTVLITGSGQNIEYWFNPTIANTDLVPKGASFDTGSLVTTSSFNSWTGSGTFGGTASLAVVTASLSGNNLTFTKGNGNQFTLIIPGTGGPGGQGIKLEISGNNLLLTSASSTLSTVQIYPASSSILANTASFVTASNVWGPFGSSSVQSASYALNGGVTSINVAGTGLSINQTTGAVVITGTGGGGGGTGNTATGSYGSFYSTVTQTNVASTARSMSLNRTDISNGVTISGSTNPFNTYIKTENPGVYDIQFSAQVDKTDSGTDEIWIWLRKNGIDVTDSATSLQLVGNGDHYVAAWNFFVNSAANDYYQLMWYSTDPNVRLHAEAGFGVVPGIPSLIVTVNRVDQFLSNTGSFTGSFTGNLIGTASWATNASTASFVTASNVWGPFGSSSVMSASYALTASYISGTVQATPGGSNTQIQFNSASVLSGSANLTFNYTTNIINLTGAISASAGPNTVGFYGTASWAVTASHAITSSYVLSASYATSASYVLSSSYATTASFVTSASYATSASQAQSASYVLSSSYATSASYVLSSSYATTASFVLSSSFATTASYVLSSSFATTASYVLSSSFATTASYALSASLATTASYALSSSFATTASYALSSSFATTASYVLSSSFATTASYVLSSSYATTASYVLSSSYADTASFTLSSSFATTASYVLSSSYATTASFVLSSSFATTASYVLSSSFATTASYALSSSHATTASYVLSSSFATTASYVLSASYAATSSVILVTNTNDTTPDSDESLHLVLAYSGSETGVKELQVDTSLRYRPLGNYLYIPSNGALVIGNTTFQSTEATFGSANAQNNVIYLTGSLNVSKSINVDGRVQISGSLNTTGSIYHLGLITSSTVVDILTYNPTTGEVFYTASSAIGGGSSGPSGTPGGLDTQIQFSSGSEFSGSTNFTFDYSSSVNVVRLTGSLLVSGAISAAPFDTYIQFNSGGLLHATSSLTYNYSQSILVLTGSLQIVGSAGVTGSVSVTQNITSSRALISSSGGNQLTVIGSGLTAAIAQVFGSQGNLLTISDSLSGSLLTVSDISGYPILDVVSDESVLIGNYQAPARYTSAKITTINGINTVYSMLTSSYNGAFFDYTLVQSTNARAGQIMSIWNGSTIRYTETTTTDIGSTSDFAFSVALGGGSASLRCTTTTAGATIKTIIKNI